MAKNTNAVELDKPDSTDDKVELDKEKSKVVWQAKYRNYVVIMPWVDESQGRTRDGRPVNAVVKARNWRIELDLSIPEHKKKHDELVKMSKLSNAIFQLTGREHEDKARTRAKTLEKLWEMDLPQIKAMFTPEELERSGLTGNVTKAELITVIMDTKKLVGGGE